MNESQQTAAICMVCGYIFFRVCEAIIVHVIFGYGQPTKKDG